MSLFVRRALKISSGLLAVGLSASLLAVCIANLAPIIDSSPYPVAELGQPYRYAVHATDPEGNDVGYSLQQGPAGMGYSASDQSLQWTPSANQLGQSQITVRARDSWGASDDQSFTLRTVADYCELYPITVPQQLLANVQSGALLNQIARGTGAGNFSWLSWSGSTSATTLATSLVPPGNSYNYTNPDAATDHLLEINNWVQGATGSMNSSSIRNNLDVLKSQDIIIPTWAAVRGQGSQFDYRVAKFAIVRLKDYQLNGQGWMSFEFRGYKNCYNDVPVAVNQTRTTPEDQSLPLTLAATDPENNALSYRIVQVPMHGQLVGTAPSLTYMPDANYSGPDSFTFRANDGEFDSNIGTVSITVTPVNDLPTAGTFQLQTNEDTAVPANLLGQDAENNPLTFIIVNAPGHGSLSGTGAARTYQPAANYFGTDQFTYRVNDGTGDSALATVVITIQPVNDLPTAGTLQLQTNEDTSVWVNLQGHDTENSPLSYIIVDAPAHGILSGAGAARTYVPAANFHGTDQFTYRVNDGTGDSPIATVTITIQPVNDLPTANSQQVQTHEDAPLAVQLTGTDADGDDLDFSIRQTTTHGSLVGSGADWEYRPNPNFFGEDQFTFVSRDGQADSSLATVNIVVLERNAAPVAASRQYSVLAGTPLAITLAGSDPDGDDVSFRVLTTPGHGQLSGTAPALNFVADASFTGTLTLSYVANDGRLDSLPATVSIEVTTANAAPTITSTPINFVGDNQPFSYIVAASDPDAGDVLTYSSDSSSTNYSVESDSGFMTWVTTRVPQAGVREKNLACRAPSPRKAFDPVLAWGRSGPSSGNNIARILGPVLVAQLTDDNQDGRINQGDHPDVVTYSQLGDSLSYAYLIALHGNTGETIFEKKITNLGALGTPALGDLDNDGVVEIAVIEGATADNIAVYENDGSFKWRATVPAHVFGDGWTRDALAIADLDADGTAEIIRGATIVNNNGTVRCTGTGDRGGSDYAYVSIVADIDLDGKQEIIAGRSIYNSQCQLIRQLPAVADGFAAVGNFDEDDYPEIVLHSNGTFGATGRLYVFNHDGSKKFGPVTHPGAGAGGPPTLANVDDDPYPEIGVAGRSQYVVFDNTGSILWANTTQDLSSHHTGSTSFDFDGDGNAEIVYGDEVYIRIWDGRSGALRYQVANPSGTTIEYPVIADITGDKSADIIFGMNDGNSGGIRVLSSSSGSWPNARPLWNQHAFSVTNINDDGSIPARPEPSWLAHNSYRLNTWSKDLALGQTDLALFDLRLDPSDQSTLRLTATNRGLASATTGTFVRFYDDEPASGRLLGSVRVGALAAGQSINVSLTGVNAHGLGDKIYAVIDDVNAIPECAENNNSLGAEVFHVRVTDRAGLFDRQVFTIGIVNINQAPSMERPRPGPARLGHLFTYTVTAIDPDAGDGLFFSLVTAPAGMTIESVSGELRWTPTVEQVGESTVTVRVTDLRGYTDNKNFTIAVLPNSAPEITSSAGDNVEIPGQYRYDVDADDADGDIMSFALVSKPTGMVINGATGVITWTPTAAQVGSVNITVKVTDTNGGTGSQTFAVMVNPPENGSPTFVSSPVVAVVLGQRYQYNASAIDPEEDPLIFSVVNGPLGMTVDTIAGTVVWQPRSDQVGTHIVTLQVSDPSGSTEIQEFELVVSAGIDSGNHPPRFISVPETSVLISANYTYQARATDIDDDRLSYALDVAPDGMSIDADSGVLTWTPLPAQTGFNEVSITVSDGRGASSTQSFPILATTVAMGGVGNRPPTITSDPLTLVRLGQTYRYYIAASDPDGDGLEFVILDAPEGMTLDAGNRVLVWTPDSLGTATVTVQVIDERGGSSTQSYTVEVVDTDTPIDHRPVLLEPPFAQAKVGAPYVVSVQAFDADGDTMSFVLVNGPGGASINATTGQVSWTPATTGNMAFVVRVSAGGGYTDVAWEVHVIAADIPLTLNVVVSPDRVMPGAPMMIEVGFDGAAGPVDVQASLSGTPLDLDAGGSTTLVAPTTPGHYLLTVTVDDGNTTATDSIDVYIIDVNDTMPPVVELTSPDIDARVTAPTPVSGRVQGADVVRWTLSVIDKTSGAMSTIAEGRQAAGPGVLGQFDPTLLNNGVYTLVLQGWDAGGNLGQDSTTVVVDGDMKLGHYSVSFEDVSIPMAGIPLRVTRTYDTRRRDDALDFGYGWSVDYQNVRITESRRAGFSWTLQQIRSGFFGNWCVRPNGDPIVAITLPDGELMKFRAKAIPECQFLVPQTDVQLVYEPLPGTNAQLDQTDYGSVRLGTFAGSGVYNLLDISNPDESAVDPSHYRLKLPDGTVYSLTQGVGINTITEPNGHTLTYTRNGVKHSLGQEVKFLRNGQGRIEEIVLPDGQRRRYTYTPGNDLEMAVDTGGDITSFGYLSRAPHYLQDIVDPRGVRVSRNEYDDDGRLVATIDADGHRIEYTHNLAGRTEIIMDRRGNATVYGYDEEGRITAESNALGETILRTYNSNGDELTTTDALNHRTVRTFDARGNQLTETNPLGQKVTRSFDDRNNVLTETDALGRVVATNSYNAYTGSLVMTRNALGQVTSFNYDSGFGSGGTGELLAMTDAADQQTRYALNYYGQRRLEVDALGRVTLFDVDAQGRVHGETRTRTLADGSTETLVTRYTLDAKDRVIATVHPDGSRTTTEYDGNDKPTKTCDGLNRCTVQEYDARGHLAKTTYPDGSFETMVYDPNGNVTAQTDRAGRTTKMVYDAANRLVETILPDATPGTDADNPRTRSEYDAAGRMIASINERGVRTGYGYDDAGRRTRVTDALGHSTTTFYDAAGQRESVTDALGRTTRFVYDAVGRLTQTIHPDETAASDDNPLTTVEYDAVGRKVAETDEMGRRKQLQYDALGRVVAVTLPNPATGLVDAGALVTRFVYDEVGNKTQQIDALGRITRWTHDAMGRELSRTLPLGQTETFAYDAAGQRIRHTDFKGVVTQYGYDEVGRMELVDYATDADVFTTYTASGQRESVTDGQGTTLYVYTTRDQLQSVTTPDGQVITYAYDAAGNRTELHSAALDQVFVYDELNRLHEVRSQTLDGPVRTATHEYDEVGNRRLLVSANGTTTTTAFDVRNRLRQLVTRTAASVVLFGATYTVDASGLRTGIGEFDAQGITRSVGYAYDGSKRLLAEAIERPGQSTRVTTYVYDAVGNRLTKTEAGTLTSYIVDGNDRLTRETTGGISTIYTFDANGNTTGQAKPGEVMSFAYDQANRRVRTTTAAGIIETGYSADGIRNRETASGQTTSWLIDPNRDYAQTLEAYSGNQLSTVWLYGDTLLAQGNVVAGTLRETHLHADGMGSVRQASNAGGSVTDTFEYDAFGNELGRTGSTDIDHRYRGEQVDGNTGFYNLRARWYDPNSGRFASMDEFEGRVCEPLSLHDYIYAHDDPVNLSDPSGYSPLLGAMTEVNLGSYQRASSAVQARNTYKRVKTALCRIPALGIVHGHHMLPVFMGGAKPRSSGNVINIDAAFHKQFHQLLHYMLRFNGMLGGNVAKSEWDAVFASTPNSRKAAHKVLIQASKIFDKACQLKTPNAITPVIKQQIRDGKWDF